MSLKLNEALKILSGGLATPPKPEHKQYVQDAVEISEKINQELINMDSIFKETVSDWEDTCTYLLKDIYKIWIPFLCINMPFKIEPELVKPHQFKLKSSANHAAVENGYVNGIKLTKLFYLDMKQSIEKLGKVDCKSGKRYNYLTPEYFELEGKQYLRIVVKENEAQEAPSILYNFNISFTFSQESPSYHLLFEFFHLTEKSIFKAMSTNISKMVNEINILLLQFHLDESLTVEKMHNITTNAFLCSKYGNFDEILLEVMKGCIPFIKNPRPLMCAFVKLWKFKQADSVTVSELKELFGIQ
ncbi:uncharacterized protein LOC110190256 [Drosophila serrata]|uniref:uncharacterized protein LOC110190256 n=1 Tax=Drosophila serrata TaxID=7274 RepID=UPI000A1D196F|nr:uncharacterized protein LOC110190256 [Drosophila serrata]